MNSFLDKYNIEHKYNIERSTGDIEYHPLKPFVFADTKILFLGSFPPQRKRWCIDFFYPNFINDHWRIQGLVFCGDKDAFVDTDGKLFDLPKIIAHCKTHGLGFYDTATAIRRLNDNASDKFLEVVEPTDICKLVKQADCLKAIVTTGTKATETICDYFGIKKTPGVGKNIPLPQLGNIVLYRLPSSSRAYPLSLEKKADAYKRMFDLFL